MNPKHLSIRLDPNTGNIWLFDQNKRKRIKDITGETLYALCSDPLVQPNGQSGAVREVVFTEPDGSKWAASFEIKTRRVENEGSDETGSR